MNSAVVGSSPARNISKVGEQVMASDSEQSSLMKLMKLNGLIQNLNALARSSAVEISWDSIHCRNPSSHSFEHCFVIPRHPEFRNHILNVDFEKSFLTKCCSILPMIQYLLLVITL